MTRLGLGVGNQPPITGEEIDAMLDIRPAAYLVLDGQLKEGEAIHRRDPGATILWRKYHTDTPAHDPVVLATEDAAWLTAEVYQRVYGGQGPVHFVGWNELNIPGEWPSNTERQWDSPALYEYLNDWCLAYTQTVHTLCPWAVVHFGAFSPGHNEDGVWVNSKRVGDWSGIKFCAGAIHECDVYDMHGYWAPWWNPDWEPGLDWNGIWQGARWKLQKVELDAIGWADPTFITEWNRECWLGDEGDEHLYAEEITAWFANLPDWIDYAVHFIFSGWGLLSIYPGRESVRTALKALKGQETPMPEFRLGFQSLADRLGADVVGEPEGEEFSFNVGDGKVWAIQSTTKGVMSYFTGGQPQFLVGQKLPKVPAP